MTLVYSSPQAAPPLLGSPWPGAAGTQVRRATRRAAAAPLAVCLGVQWIFLVAWAVPETVVLPARAWWLVQLAPLGLVPGHRLGALGLLACATALLALSRSRSAAARTAMTVPALLGSVVGGLVLVQLLVTGTAGASALGVLLLVAWLVAAWYAAVHGLLVDLGPPAAPTPRTGLVLLALWVLLLPGPLALGRLLLARDLRAEAEVLTGNTVALSGAALVTSTSVRLFLFGAVLGAVAWLGHQCWPRRASPRSWRWYVALALALLALTQLWWSAQTSAAQRVTTLQYGSPAAELHFTCGTWVYPPAPGTPADTPTLTVVASGLGCREVTTFSGFRQAGTTATTVSVSPVALRAPALPGEPEDTGTDPDGTGPAAGDPGTSTAAPRMLLAGARYGRVLVLAASDRVDRVADQLVAVPLRGGQPLWRFSCADKREVRARFAGGQPDPAVPVVLAGEPGPVVVLTCGEQELRLDPVTGLTAG